MTYKHVLAALLLLAGVHTQAQRVVMIGLDGFSAEGFNEIKHPRIDEIFAKGVMTVKNRPVMPSVTLPNWTSHLTGQGPEEHGVTANDWTLQKHALEAIEVDQDGYSPSIFKLLKDQKSHAKTAFYYNWAELINPINKKYLDEVSFEANDKYEGNYAKALDFLVKNEKDPSLVFLYSVHTDHAGHNHKWMSKEYRAAIEEADAAIGRFADKLKEQGLYEGTYFMLITDHGGVGTGHGGISMNEMQTPWGITGKKIKNLGLTDVFMSSNKNTAVVLSKIFRLKNLPKSWVGVAPKEIFR